LWVGSVEFASGHFLVPRILRRRLDFRHMCVPHIFFHTVVSLTTGS